MASRGRHLDQLARRVARIERGVPAYRREEWRAYLEPFFADEEYAEQRTAIIEALCSQTPEYCFSAAGDGLRGGATYLITWYAREGGREPPEVLVISVAQGPQRAGQEVSG